MVASRRRRRDRECNAFGAVLIGEIVGELDDLSERSVFIAETKQNRNGVSVLRYRGSIGWQRDKTAPSCAKQSIDKIGADCLSAALQTRDLWLGAV